MWELAQVNVGYTLGPMDSEVMRTFADLLDPVNALADAAPGFVWRLQSEEGDATALRGTDDALLLNMSTWTSLETFAEFAFRGFHAEVMRRRREWFSVMREAYTCCWWVPTGHRPTITEAEVRLAHLREHGPTPVSFTVRKPFPAPDGIAVESREDWLCGSAS